MKSDVSYYSGKDFEGFCDRYIGLPHEIVVSGYLVHGKKVCLLDHRDLHKWLPPGGHLKKEESPINALKREVLEETGCTIDLSLIGRLYGEDASIFQVPPPRFIQHELIEEEKTPPHVHVNLVYFCKALDIEGQIITDEGPIKWFTMNELDDVERLYPHTRMNAIAAIRELGDVIPDTLTIESNRILVPIGGRCPYGCKYCYTKRYDVYFGEPNPEATVNRLRHIIGNKLDITAQLGYDNDPFCNFEIGIEFIFRMLWLPVHIGFSTKAIISTANAKRISELRSIKKSYGYNISGLVTLTCIKDSTVVQLEPNAPSPEKRLATINNLVSNGIPTMVNLRPILSDIVDEDELRQVIDASKDAGACGVVLGAFWTDPEGVVCEDLINPDDLELQNSHVEWSPHGLNWSRHEDPDLLKRLLDYCDQKKIIGFESSAKAVKYLNSLD